MGAGTKGGALAVAGEGGLDTAIAAVAVPFPHAGVVLAGLKALGKAGLAGWTRRDAQKSKKQLETVMVNAFSALVSGDPDVAAAEIAAHLDDPSFTAGVRAAAARMAESNPCDEALQPLGMLIAAYKDRRPDPLFRNAASFLSDCSPADLVSAGTLVHAIRKVGYRHAEITIVPDLAGPRVRFAGRQGHVDASIQRHRVVVRCPSGVGDLLLAHALADRSTASGAYDDTHDPAVIKIDPKALDLLCKLLRGVAADSAAADAT